MAKKEEQYTDEELQEHKCEIYKNARVSIDLPLDEKRQIAKVLSVKHPSYSQSDVLAVIKRFRTERDLSQLKKRKAISIESHIQRSIVFSDIYNVFKNCGDFFNYGKKLAQIKEDVLNPVIKYPQLQWILNNYIECYTTNTLKGGEVETVYKLLPRDLSEAYLAGSPQDNFREVNLVTDVPIIDHQYKTIKSGYNKDLKVYRKKSVIKSMEGLTVLENVLADFAFQDPVIDKTNFIGACLLIFVQHLFPGHTPLIDVEGNQLGLGKTLLCKILAIIRQGAIPRTVQYTSDDIELEKRIASECQMGSRGQDTINIIIFDNVKGYISSSVLEKCITDTLLSFRLLGGNDVLVLINNILFVMNMNKGTLSPDLISRKITIRLYHEGDPKLRTFSQNDLLKYVLDNRGTILGELLGMIEVWQKKNCPLKTINHRCNATLNIVGGILEVNGHRGFLGAEDESCIEQDTQLRDFIELAKLTPIDTSETAKKMWHRALKAQLFSHIAKKDNERSQVSSFGKVLVRFIGRSFVMGSLDEVCVFKKGEVDSNKTRLYSFDRMSGCSRMSNVENIRKETSINYSKLSENTGCPDVISPSSVNENKKEKES